MIEDKSTVDKLIQLSKIFKEGFTIAINGGKIEQVNINKGYVVSYKTIITINLNRNNIILHDCKIPLYTHVGGWLDKNTIIYYIELNTIYRFKRIALAEGKILKQKAIYDLYAQKEIKIE